MIEVGGAHAYKFVPLMEFLHIPYLIITDVDYIGKRESTKRPQAVDEEENATGTSNPSIKNWLEGKGINDIHALKDLKDEDKTWGLCGRIAFQEPECGKTPRSLEPAIHAVNTYLKKYKEGSSKIDYALDIITNTEVEKFAVPRYIDKGLEWLMNKR